MDHGGLGIGELARASGLTVRTLRYYDQIGLLTPSGRSGAGHRLYARADVSRLYRICVLRRTGLPLAEIGRARVYEDIPAMHARLVRVFGLGAGRLDRDDQGRWVHGEVEAGDSMIWLHQVSERWGLASPKTVGAATGTTAVMVDDVDVHHRHAVAEGAEILYPPCDQPYGYREYSARDPEGALWSFMKPLDPLPLTRP